MVCAGAYAPTHTVFREFFTKLKQIPIHVINVPWILF